MLPKERSTLDDNFSLHSISKSQTVNRSFSQTKKLLYFYKALKYFAGVEWERENTPKNRHPVDEDWFPDRCLIIRLPAFENYLAYKVISSFWQAFIENNSDSKRFNRLKGKQGFHNEKERVKIWNTVTSQNSTVDKTCEK